MQFVTVGNSGNAPDTAVMNDGTTGYGAVNYTYDMATTDVTNAEYVKFLNAKATGADPLGLYNSNMSNVSNPVYGGIMYSFGTYSVRAGFYNYPVVYVTWYDAFRFVNWLDNGQGNGDTETGAYTLLGGTPTPTNANSITRNAATFFLPSENEWYKAAFYNPSTSSYFQYPTSSNTAPTPQIPPGGTNSANYDGGANFYTSVGAYTGTTSPYGLFDMGGDAAQWNDTLIPYGSDLYPGFRGESFLDNSTADMRSTARFYTPATRELLAIGFRIAAVPEPASGALLLLGALIVVLNKRRPA